jgi:hypothetical protein
MLPFINSLTSLLWCKRKTPARTADIDDWKEPTRSMAGRGEIGLGQFFLVLNGNADLRGLLHVRIDSIFLASVGEPDERRMRDLPLTEQRDT